VAPLDPSVKRRKGRREGGVPPLSFPRGEEKKRKEKKKKRDFFLITCTR